MPAEQQLDRDGPEYCINLALQVVLNCGPSVTALAYTSQVADFIGLGLDNGLLQTVEKAFPVFQ